MAESVLESAHEECSPMAACGQGNGPCIVYFRAEIARLEREWVRAIEQRDEAVRLAAQFITEGWLSPESRLIALRGVNAALGMEHRLNISVMAELHAAQNALETPNHKEEE